MPITAWIILGIVAALALLCLLAVLCAPGLEEQHGRPDGEDCG